MGPIFFVLVVGAVLIAFATGRLEELQKASLDSASQAFTIALGLVGVMSLWLGLVEVMRRGGLMDSLARGLRPIFRRLFPEVPDGHPALSAVTLNISANMLGLTNAATPFGIDAMRHLDRLNGTKGTITNAMALFLAINTSGVSLIPMGVIGVRATLGSQNPAGILFTTLLATSCSTAVAIVACKLLARLPRFQATVPEPADEPDSAAPHETRAELPVAPAWRRWVARALFALAVLLLGYTALQIYNDHGWGEAWRGVISYAPMMLVLLAIVLYGFARGVEVYAAIVDGAKEGFQVAIRITPYMVAVLVAVGMFRGSGALDMLVNLIAPLTTPLGFPPEALPMALVRPLSGSGALAVMTEISKTYGPDSFIGYLVATINGSFETTFYVLAVYGGAIGLRRTRHTVLACLIGDIAGVIGATLACSLLVGRG